jgi:tRNA-Thr(GGU) m(6)t(6)A37 methyltransferase TsaA
MEFRIKPVGLIHTPHTTKEETPIQGAFQPAAVGTVELFAEFVPGLKDIELFSHLVLIYHFHRCGKVELVRKPFLDDIPHGIFATRHPCRPNGIGVSTVRLLGRDGNTLRVSGIDVLDGTPLLDIKPYVTRFDSFPGASEGWFADKENRKKPPGRE